MKRAESTVPRVGIGTEFRMPYADDYALFRVIKRQRRGVYLCEGVNEPIDIDGRLFPSDAAGVRQLVLVEQIRNAILQERASKAARRQYEDFYANLEVGSIVHYHDAFGRFVRCEVVRVTESRHGFDNFGEAKPGSLALKEVALVGAWSERDLRLGEYHVRGIRHGRVFRPHQSNIYENPSATISKSHLDPRTMDPHPIPEMPPCPSGVDAAWHERMMEEQR